MSDRQRGKREAEAERVEEQEQRDPEHDVGDHERAQEQRRHRRHAAESSPRQRERGENSECNGAEAREDGDDRARPQRRVEIGVVQELAIPLRVKPLSGKVGRSESLNEKMSRIRIGA